jgi:hypothetical protein
MGRLQRRPASTSAWLAQKIKSMQALLDHLAAVSLPFNDRPNVSAEPVQSITLGLVNQRQAGYGLSAATTMGRLQLLKLLVALVDDAAIAGTTPEHYTSICVNTSFPAGALHIDRHNVGDSWLTALGEFEGGAFFIEQEPVGGQGERATMDDGSGGLVEGSAVNIKNRWLRFNGSKRHCPMPYAGFRCTVVYFSVPIEKCQPQDLATLSSLGFQIPVFLPLGIPMPWPYHVYICSTRRSATICKDTLTTLLSDGSVPAHTVTLCVRDAEDAKAYGGRLGLRMLVAGEGAGLPAQRRLCTRHAAEGSWCLHLDDDVTHVQKPGHLSMHELFVLGFVVAGQRKVHLWGLNTSANPLCMRETVSAQLGQINGYFHGLIVCKWIAEPTRTSDAVGGAAEDIERSLRYFLHSGIVRLNFACASARVQTNGGGLQAYYSTRDARLAARDYVVHALCAEFPTLLRAAPKAPNGCRFVRGAAAQRDVGDDGSSSAPGQQLEVQEQDDEGDSPAEESSGTGTAGGSDCTSDGGSAGNGEKDAAPGPRSTEKYVCEQCASQYARRADLQHHVLQVHADAPAEKVACPTCERAFRRRKDMVLHVRLGRCHSKRGKKWDA